MGSRTGARSASLASGSSRVTARQRVWAIPAWGQHGVGCGLVHAQRRGQHPGSGVGDPGQLQQALNRAVLAHRAVKDGQHHRGTASVGAAAGTAKLGAGGQRGQGLHLRTDGAETLGQSVRTGAEGLDGLRSLHPAAFPGDADRLDDVLVRVGCSHHVTGRHAGHVVFGGASPEQHHQPHPAVLHVGDASAGRPPLPRGRHPDGERVTGKALSRAMGLPLRWRRHHRARVTLAPCAGRWRKSPRPPGVACTATAPLRSTA